MNLKILCNLLNEFGMKFVLKGNVLEEEHDKYYNYSLIVKQDNKWFSGIFEQEKQSKPYFSFEEFNNESEVSKKFFIEHLGSSIQVGLLSPDGRYGTSGREGMGFDICKDNFNEEKFRHGMDIRKVPQYRFSTVKENVSERTVRLLKEETDKYRLYFIGGDNKIVGEFKSLLDAREALFRVYELVFTLDFFEKKVVPALKREGVYEEFTDDDVYKFIS
jgi:hypothetical protein